MARVVVTGASRGLGLEMARIYARRGDEVFAGCRGESEALAALETESEGRARPLRLDVADEGSIGAAVAAVEARWGALDVLVNNAGIPHSGVWEESENWGTLTFEGLEKVLRTNLFGATILTQALAGALERGASPRVGFVSSRFSQIGERPEWFANNFGYSFAKVGLNMLARTLALRLADGPVVFASLDPGWCRTDMGGPDAPTDPAESAAGMIAALDAVTRESSGGYFEFTGARLTY